jgi:hypothetical protein
MAFYEKQKQKQVTLGYVQISDFRHRLLGQKAEKVFSVDVTGSPAKKLLGQLRKHYKSAS